MIRRVLVQSDAHKAPQRQRVRQPPGNPALRPDALEIPDQQRPKVNPRRQRRAPVLLRIKLRAPALDKLVEALGLQQFIQPLIEWMPRSRCQLRMCDLLASPAACASPSPCADSTNQACGYLNSFWLTNPNLHHGLLGFLVWTERVWTEGVCKDDE